MVLQTKKLIDLQRIESMMVRQTIENQILLEKALARYNEHSQQYNRHQPQPDVRILLNNRRHPQPDVRIFQNNRRDPQQDIQEQENNRRDPRQHEERYDDPRRHEPRYDVADVRIWENNRRREPRYD
eukprot:1012670_1